MSDAGMDNAIVDMYKKIVAIKKVSKAILFEAPVRRSVVTSNSDEGNDVSFRNRIQADSNSFLFIFDSPDAHTYPVL